jgi:hypothetical protein
MSTGTDRAGRRLSAAGSPYTLARSSPSRSWSSSTSRAVSWRVGSWRVVVANGRMERGTTVMVGQSFLLPMLAMVFGGTRSSCPKPG